MLITLRSPLISYDSVSSDVDRLAKIKNFTLFDSDLASNKLPQWMFITPNMTNDGHDSSIVRVTTFEIASKTNISTRLSRERGLKASLSLYFKTPTL